MRICNVKDCGRDHHGRGYCLRHYKQFLKSGVVKGVKWACRYENCDKKLIGKRTNQIFCSSKCRNAFHAKTEATVRSQNVYRETDRCKLLTSIRKEKYRLSGKAKIYCERYRNLYPEKRRAGYIAYNNFNDSELCSIEGCEKEGHRHHPDYTKPLEIIWLCSGHHIEEHKYLKECQI